MPPPARLWRIRRIYLDRIGAPAARFRDVWLEFGSRTGNPLDTILWMRNGGGKSTLIALICASIRPARNDYLATAETGRHLEDCVLGADTAHIAIEWQDPEGTRMVTGAVYEWTDRIQPADPNASWEQLQQRWYAFTPSRPGAELEVLPFHDDNQHPTTLKAFADAIAALPPEADAVVIDYKDQGKWTGALQDRGLDPGLFSAILKINASEGGIEKQFKFSTTDEFVRYLLSLVGDSAASRRLSTMLGKHRASIARHPRLRTELDFTQEAVEHLKLLKEDHRRLHEAEEARATQRHRARTLAASFSAAAGHARNQVARFNTEADDHRERRKQAADNADAYERLHREYHWWAAHLLDEATRAASTEADKTVADRDRLRQAWHLVPTLVQHAELSAELKGLREQQTRDEADAAPVRERYQQAAAQLIAVLDRSRRDLETAIDANEKTAAAAEKERRKAQDEIGEADRELGALTAESTQLTRSITVFETAVARAVADGHLPAGAHLADTHTACADQHARLVRELDVDMPDAANALAERRSPIDAEHRELGTQIANLKVALRKLNDERQPLLDQISSLSRHNRLTLLAQSGIVDPVAENGALQQALTDAIIEIDRERIDLSVEDADDRRALRSLAGQSGLLPASLDLTRAADILREHSIPATTGWHYLADAVAPALWQRAITSAPSLVAGLLVYDADDLGVAQQRLDAAALTPGTTVQVSTTRALQDAIDTDAGTVGGFVVAPAAALFDRDAVTAEVERRETASATRADHLRQLELARDHDKQLIHELALLATTCPPGHLEHLAAEHDRITAAVAVAEKRHSELTAQLADLDVRAAQLSRQREEAIRKERIMSSRVHILSGLAQQLPAITELRTRLAQVPAAREALEAARALAVASEQELRTVSERANGEVSRDRRVVAGYIREATEFADDAGEATDEAEAVTLAQARSTFETARKAHQIQASRSVIAAQIEGVTGQMSRLAATMAVADQDVRGLANDLAATPAASDPAMSAELTATAEAQYAEALGERAVKRSDATEADTALQKASRTRPVRVELLLPVTEPADLDHARRLRTDAEENQERHRAQRQAAAEALGRLETRIEQLTNDADQFDGLAASLMSDEDQVMDVTVPPAAYAGAITDAMAEADTARRELTTADRSVGTARAAVTERGHVVSRWSAEARFAAVSAEVKVRFSGGEHTSGLAEEADHLIAEITLYRANLQGQIDEVEQDKEIVVSALCEEARTCLKMLQRAQTQAQLPAGIGDHLKNRRFLDVGPKHGVDTSPPVMRSRISALVDGLVQSEAKTQPDGKTLTWQAVSAAVGGPGHFRARVLKPSTNLADEREPVERMGKWSGGEKVTISLLLFCMLARLRAASRGTDHPGLGVLPMDNPLGTVNYVAFLDLQRRVAAANGIQLIFLSGLADMRAIGRFPNIIRMKNTHNHDRTYAQVSERSINDDNLAAAITTARLTFPLQESLL
ncbi:hypothetical protein GCM10010124_31020 [Pilimelia terevasa]|uniref:Uncharacterized protein n=1 Tax=Pilimelia terevasa TaxID=53372 RepID=A0A8J3FK28_9ACTN|nr:hypothetical protein [Pilimelia terevasa]GGK36203.1 hypothetical protein GCM10010124_31020 [Pilimelia terevasa]